MKTLPALLALLLLPTLSSAAWVIKSEFRLSLNEGIFDELVGDFWRSLQGSKNVNIGDFTITPQGIPVQIRGVKASVTYDFHKPERLSGSQREWKINLKDLDARLTVDQISATQTIVREIDGIIVTIEVKAECRNLVMSLPAGSTSIEANVRAELAQNQIKLSLPSYAAAWKPGSWRVDSVECSGLDGFDNLVRESAIAAFSSFQNFDQEVKNSLNQNFAKWSEQASLLLLSERELPSGKDYMKIFYQPENAWEKEGGLELSGTMRFEYPFVSQGNDMEQEFKIQNAKASSSTAPQLLIPFGAVNAMLMGEYFSGQLEYSLRSYEVPGFSNFMNSYWQKVWAWPELLRFNNNTTFLFQFLPMGPPAFSNEKSMAGGVIQGNLNLPLSVRMYAPMTRSKYVPMVEFRSLLAGPARLKLGAEGVISLQVDTKPYNIQYEWAKSYVSKYDPSQRIATDTIGEEIRGGLNKQGINLKIPPLEVSNTLFLSPQSWNLEGQNLRVNFGRSK